MKEKVTKDNCGLYKDGGCTSKDNSICGFVCGNKGTPFSQVNGVEYAKATGIEPKKEPERKKAVPVVIQDDEEPGLF